MTAPQTASQVATHLLALARDLDRQTRELAEVDEQSVRARARFEVRNAREFLDAEGSVDQRKQTARLATADEWLEVELLDARVRGAKAAIRALETRIECGRSYGTALRSEIALSGMTS